MQENKILRAIQNGLRNYYQNTAAIALPSEADFDKQAYMIKDALLDAGYIIIEGKEYEVRKPKESTKEEIKKVLDDEKIPEIRVNSDSYGEK